MSTADELLASVASDSDKVLIIDNDLRTITIPTSIKSLGVESDENVLRLYFKMPKMYGDTDLSSFSIRINYMNAKNEGDVYVVDDAVVGTDDIEFSWLIGRMVTAYKGTVRFIVCLKQFDENDELIKEYNTTIASLSVLEGLETSDIVVEHNPDVIESILLRLDAVENNSGSGSGVSDYNLLENQPVKNVLSNSDSIVYLRDLDSGVYRLSGTFLPFEGSSTSCSFSNNQFVNVVKKTAGSHIQIFYPVNNVVQFVSIMVDTTSEAGYTYERTDVKLNNLQTKPKATTIDLPASGWAGEGMVYSQTVSVSSITESSQVELRPSPEQLQELLTSEISLTAANDSGTVTVFAIGGIPTSDYSMQIVISEVEVI